MKYFYAFILLFAMLVSTFADELSSVPRLYIVTPNAIFIDNVARSFANYLHETRKINVAVITAPGAGGDISAQKALRDPYSVLLAWDGLFNINTVTNKNQGFTDKDFTIIPPLLLPPWVLVTSEKSGIHNLSELQTALSNKKELLVGIPGPFPTYYNGVLMNKHHGNVTQIYYKTQPDLQLALMRGDIDYAFVPASPIFMKTENINFLGVTGKMKLVARPDLPLLSDQYPEMSLLASVIFAVPEGRNNLVSDLSKAWEEYLRIPGNADYVRSQGLMVGDFTTIDEANVYIKKTVKDAILNLPGVEYHN